VNVLGSSTGEGDACIMMRDLNFNATTTYMGIIPYMRQFPSIACCRLPACANANTVVHLAKDQKKKSIKHQKSHQLIACT
jgi:hypothetical protein